MYRSSHVEQVETRPEPRVRQLGEVGVEVDEPGQQEQRPNVGGLGERSHRSTGVGPPPTPRSRPST